MKILKKISAIFLLIFTLILLTNKGIFASNIVDSITVVEYSDDFKEWLILSDEEKKNVIMPRIYEVPNSEIKYKNLLLRGNILDSSLSDRYSLKDVIPNNLAIRNQEDTGLCWAFSSLSSLETNLALSNYKNNINTSKVYDFSERHMEYATSRYFSNNVENPNGYNRAVNDGGNFFISSSYLANGYGAVTEKEMPFENNINNIDINKIENKTVSTQLYDTIEFPDFSKETKANKAEFIKLTKQHIKNHGSIYAGVHGTNLLFSDCYNNETGAMFCNNEREHRLNHSVSIIGWDDNYSIDNFNEGNRPKSNGAWIVRNSWGEKIEYDLETIKQEMFSYYKTQFINLGWNDATHITNEFLEDAGFVIEGNKAYIKVGDNGIMYVSYEDVNIYKILWGIIKASDKVNYDNIYQYDILYPATYITHQNSKIMLASNFEKKTAEREYLTQVSLYAPETYTCRVYVNPNGTSKTKEDLQLVILEAGESETFDTGYHTLEFAKPIEIKSKEFTVVVEITGTRSNVNVALETKFDGIPTFDTAKSEKGKCFLASGHTLEKCEWIDLGTLEESKSSLKNGDSTIKAFTVNNIVEKRVITGISISKKPSKLKYIQNKEDLDLRGGSITATYSDGSTEDIEMESEAVKITGFNNKKLGKVSINVEYQGKNAIFEVEIIAEAEKTEDTKEENEENNSGSSDDKNTEEDSKNNNDDNEYKNDTKPDNNTVDKEDNKPDNNPVENDKKTEEDDNLSKEEFPKTGIGTFYIVMVFICAIIVIICYLRYRRVKYII